MHAERQEIAKTACFCKTLSFLIHFNYVTCIFSSKTKKIYQQIRFSKTVKKTNTFCYFLLILLNIPNSYDCCTFELQNIPEPKDRVLNILTCISLPSCADFFKISTGYVKKKKESEQRMKNTYFHEN